MKIIIGIMILLFMFGCSEESYKVYVTASDYAKWGAYDEFVVYADSVAGDSIFTITEDAPFWFNVVSQNDCKKNIYIVVEKWRSAGIGAIFLPDEVRVAYGVVWAGDGNTAVIGIFE